jgi:hypothetical protein
VEQGEQLQHAQDQQDGRKSKKKFVVYN